MLYPKAIMSISEIAAMGIADVKTIRQWCHIPGNDFAFKNPGGRKIRIKTREFNLWYQKQQKRVAGRNAYDRKLRVVED